MKVRFTRPAQADLERIYAYVSQDNPTEASRLIARLIECARVLGESPMKGGKPTSPMLGWLPFPICGISFFTPSLKTRCISHTFGTRRGAGHRAGSGDGAEGALVFQYTTSLTSLQKKLGVG
jgi:ParE toxin of type II toxin-antitoxin system, parDE